MPLEPTAAGVQQPVIRLRSGWDIACEWYQVEPIHRALTQAGERGFGLTAAVPRDVTSREFAEWITDQYRLAMVKGIQLARAESVSVSAG